MEEKFIIKNIKCLKKTKYIMLRPERRVPNRRIHQKEQPAQKQQLKLTATLFHVHAFASLGI